MTAQACSYCSVYVCDIASYFATLPLQKIEWSPMKRASADSLVLFPLSNLRDYWAIDCKYPMITVVRVRTTTTTSGVSFRSCAVYACLTRVECARDPAGSNTHAHKTPARSKNTDEWYQG